MAPGPPGPQGSGLAKGEGGQGGARRQVRRGVWLEAGEGDRPFVNGPKRHLAPKTVQHDLRRLTQAQDEPLQLPLLIPLRSEPCGGPTNRGALCQHLSVDLQHGHLAKRHVWLVLGPVLAREAQVLRGGHMDRDKGRDGAG